MDIPLSLLISILLREDDKVYIEPKGIAHCKLIEDLIASKNESLFHLIQNSDNSVTIWNPSDWANAYQRYEKSKLDSDKRVAEFNELKELKSELTKAIIAKVGIAMENMAEPTAEAILKSKNFVMAKMFDCSNDIIERIKKL